MTDQRTPCPIGKDTGNGCTCQIRCKPANTDWSSADERAVVVAWLRSLDADSETRSYARHFAQEIEEGRHDAG